MEEWRKIIPKGLLLAATLLAVNAAYRWWLWPADAEAHSETAHLVAQLPDTMDILYVGESSEFTHGDMDIDKRSTTAFLNEYYPGLCIGKVAKGALHAGNYLPVLREVGAPPRLKAVVVTLNLRSFGAMWIHSKLETALQKEMVLLRRGPLIWRRFLLSLRDYDDQTLAQREATRNTEWREAPLRFPYPFPYANLHDWDTSIAWGLDTLVHFQRDKEQRERAAHFVKYFAFQIDTATNPRIRDYDEIVALARDRGWTLVLNLLPEDIELGERLAGKPLADLMRANRDLLRERYGRLPGVIFVDQMESLPSRQFLDPMLPVEHYYEPGRRAVAARLAAELKTVFPDAYREPPKPAHHLVSSWANDCEGGVLWSQMQTLDAMQAHGGSRSSHTGPQAKFGVTFTYPVAELDSANLDSLVVGCWAYPAAPGFRVAVAWEILGDSVDHMFDAYRLDSTVLQPGRWQRASLRVALPPQVSRADVLKVYPYNTGGVDVWFDDIEIALKGRR